MVHVAMQDVDDEREPGDLGEHVTDAEYDGA